MPCALLLVFYTKSPYGVVRGLTQAKGNAEKVCQHDELGRTVALAPLSSAQHGWCARYLI